ncbi:MAG TPA: substrate-binding domain-containing protein [Trebonia sp.]|nr:substrate-binding domain-containing protein [Trebonia sp.]
MREIDPKVDEAVQKLNMKDGPSRRRLLTGAGMVSATAAASALLAACSSSSTGTESVSQSAAAAVAGNFPKTPAWKFYFVNHVTTNAFFTPTQYGMADAAALLGLPGPVWGGSASQNIAKMVSVFDTDIAAGAAGIALAAISATAFTSSVANAMDRGIPVVTYNADGEYINGKPVIGTNRLCYVGQSLYSSGQSMGEQIKQVLPGGGEIVIFIPQVGTGNTQPRYDGAVSVLGSSYHVQEEATGAQESVEPAAMKAYLNAHKSSLKGAFAVDSGDTEYLGAQLKSLGMSIPAGGFDTTGQTVPNVQNGTLSFTIYQDPYLQGFLPVLYLYLYNISGGVLVPPDTDTGLSVVTKTNVGPYVAASRYQGSTTAQKYIARPAGAINNPMATTST